MSNLVVTPGADLRHPRLATTVVFLLSGAGFASWAVRIPGVKAHVHANDRELGFALLGLAVGAVLSMLLLGPLITRFGSRVVLRVGLLFYALTLPLLALAPSVPWLFVALLAFGAANGVVDVAMNAQGAEVEGRLQRPAMSSFHAAFSVGGLAGAAATGALIAASVSAVVQFAGFALVLLAAAALLPRWMLREERPASGPAAVPAGRRWPRELLVLCTLAFCAALLEGSVNDWSATYLHDELRASAALAALGFVLFSLTMAAGRLSGDLLTAKFGAARLLRGGGVLAALGVLVSVTALAPVVGALGFLLVGAGIAVMFPLVISAASRLSGMTAGEAIARVSVFGYAGFLAGPPLIGLIGHGQGLRAGLLVAFAFAVLSALLSLQVDKPVARHVQAVP